MCSCSAARRSRHRMHKLLETRAQNFRGSICNFHQIKYAQSKAACQLLAKIEFQRSQKQIASNSGKFAVNKVETKNARRRSLSTNQKGKGAQKLCGIYLVSEWQKKPLARPPKQPACLIILNSTYSNVFRKGRPKNSVCCVCVWILEQERATQPHFIYGTRTSYEVSALKHIFNALLSLHIHTLTLRRSQDPATAL